MATCKNCGAEIKRKKGQMGRLPSLCPKCKKALAKKTR